jgi:hypothetical protein
MHILATGNIVRHAVPINANIINRSHGRGRPRVPASDSSAPAGHLICLQHRSDCLIVRRMIADPSRVRQLPGTLPHDPNVADLLTRLEIALARDGSLIRDGSACGYSEGPADGDLHLSSYLTCKLWSLAKRVLLPSLVERRWGGEADDSATCLALVQYKLPPLADLFLHVDPDVA